MRCRIREMLQNLSEEKNCGQTVYSVEKYYNHLHEVWIYKLVTWKLASKFVAKLNVHQKFVDNFAEKTFKKCWKLLILRQRNKCLDKMHRWTVLDICIVFKKLKHNFGTHPLENKIRFFQMRFVAKTTYFWKLYSSGSKITDSTLYGASRHL